MYKIYTDGSYYNHLNKGGWSVIVTENEEIVETLRGYQENTSVNKLELTALLEALKYNRPCIIYSDCRYVVNGYNTKLREWNANSFKKVNGNNIKHSELWKQVLKLKTKLMKVEWVKGHKNNKFNNEAHDLAKSFEK